MSEEHGHFERHPLGVWVKHSDVERMEREIERLRAKVDAAQKILEPMKDCDPDIREWLGEPRFTDDVPVTPSVHVIQVWWCQCCAMRVQFDHICECERNEN